MTNSVTFFNVSGDFQCPNDPLPQSTTSTPVMAPVQGIVTFTPRLARGFMAFVPDYQISQNSNCKQTVTLIGAITGGTWRLNFGGVWTTTLAPGATAAQLQTALAALPSIGAGNVLVTATAAGGPYTVEFTGTLGNLPQPLMASDASQLAVSSGTAAIPVDPLQLGTTSRVGPTAIALPPREGRIWTTGQLCSINATDSPDVELVANTDVLGLTYDLVYDVTFDLVQLGTIQPGFLAPFAFTAPVDATEVSITDPATELLAYQPPINQTWFPGWTPNYAGNVTPMRQRDWRKAG